MLDVHRLHILACTCIIYMYLDLCIIVHVLCTVVQWLEKDFLPYLENWEKWTQSVPNLTATEQNNMLLSAETRLGLKITCKYCMYTCRLYTCKQWWPFSIHTHVGKSFIEVVRYLFTVSGVTSFLSQRICKDFWRIPLAAKGNKVEYTTTLTSKSSSKIHRHFE